MSRGGPRGQPYPSQPYLSHVMRWQSVVAERAVKVFSSVFTRKPQNYFSIGLKHGDP